MTQINRVLATLFLVAVVAAPTPVSAQDAGSGDAGIPDGGAQDAGPADATVPDAGPPDPGTPGSSPGPSAFGPPLLPPLLVDRSLEAGLGDFRARSPSWTGVGAAFVDLDGDDWPDLFLGAGAKEKNQLCRNLRDGRFSCAPLEPPNLSDVLAVAGGDVDGDGDVDLYVMRTDHNLLLQNDGRGHFTDVTEARHAAGDSRLATEAGTFFDYDGDGRLDLYLGHWWVSEEVPDAIDQVLHQEADGSFTDVTQASGIDDQWRSTLALLAFDYDQDGRQDLYLGGDFSGSLLFHNEGGRFSDVTSLQHGGFEEVVQEAMGADAADFDGDGDIDLYVANAEPGGQLFVNRGDGTFDPMGEAFGVRGGWGGGVCWVDLDNDGWEDLFVSTDMYEQHWLYRNLGGKAFQTTRVGGLGRGGDRNCVTTLLGDYDKDGRVDVLLVRTGIQRIELLHNETPTVGHHLALLLEGAPPHRDPLGALVEVSAGGRVQRRELRSQSSRGAQNERVLHFGVGQATTVDVKVRWPSGAEEELPGLPVDGELRIGEGRGVLPPVVEPPLDEGCAMGGHAASGRMSDTALGGLALLVMLLVLRSRRSPHPRSAPRAPRPWSPAGS